MLKKLFIILAVTALTFSVSAQNSRVDAMGGCDIIDDIIGILGNPADMNDFGDQIQVTGSPGGFGPAIGIKSFGGRFNLGAMANQTTGTGSSVLRSNFYQDAQSEIETSLFANADILPSSFPVIPHLLLGLDLKAFALGLDVFIEANRFKGLSENGNDKSESNAKVSNFGTILSANIELGNFTASPLFGIGIPSAKATVETDVPVDTTLTVESEKKLFLSAGTELGFETRGLNFIGGFFYTLENYQLEFQGTDRDNNKGSFIDVYAGLITDILNGFLFVTQYNLSIEIDKAIDSDDHINKYTNLFHNFRFGFERPISGVWIFDDLVPRAGILYSLTDTSRYHFESDDGDTTIDVNLPNYSSQVQLTTGIGLRKGIAAIDVAMVIGSWDGVFTGPSVISGTVTLDFGKKSGSYESRRETRPSPSPVYESDESDYQTETEPEIETESEETESKESGSSVDFDF